MKTQNTSLTDYITTLQMSGRYTFTREEALLSLQITPEAFKLAALRLIKKKRLTRPKQGFYVIVPTEYQTVSAPPITWYIDSLMKYEPQDYYVGLLSAAALYGAAHQQPQVFQVISTKRFRTIVTGRTRLQCLIKQNIPAISYQQLKTLTGYMNVSTPEMTAFDLVRYVKSAGYLNHVATILSELQEKFDLARLSQLLATESLELPYLQRMGYLLEIVEASEDILVIIKNWINEHSPRFIPLRPDRPHKTASKNLDWHLYVNEQIESDI
jgi:predicted transcriptional regulator of viral defense system